MKKIIRILCALTLACSLLCTALTLGVGATSQAGPKQGAAQKDYSALELIPGGIPFGVKFTTDGVLIVGFCDVENGGAACNPAKEAGLKLRDILTHVGEESITSADDLTAKINASGGAALSVRYTRGGKSQTTTLTPVLDTASGSYKTGLFVRDSGAGIGTVTFLVPKTNEFAGLGHGICDVDT
ncbi:MAG: PDZ domain-containing protein, partial [Clostridia bacterium]|nr:PDZ domain-containing protein [Clostridia bacterium]